MESYQHSYPEDVQVFPTYEHESPLRRPLWKHKMAAVLVLGVVFVTALAAFDGSSRDTPTPLLQASMKATTPSAKAAAPKEAKPVEPATPDAPKAAKAAEPKPPKAPEKTSEGNYDWQKCLESNDPDCWKNEGERVGGYWQNFGLKWKAFGESMHNYFANLFGGGGDKEAAEEIDLEAATLEASKSAKAAATEPEPTEPAIPDEPKKSASSKKPKAAKEPKPPKPPQASSEGNYDWQKCKESNDPNCWKNEGERVGGYWHNFGLKWKAFGKSMHDFFANLFGGGKKDEGDATSED